MAALVVVTSVALALAGRATAGTGETGGAGRAVTERPASTAGWSPAAPGVGGAGVGRVHIVRAGETLWGLARRLAGPAGDPRPLVDRLIDANALASATIRPGDRLVLPAAP